MRKKTKILLVSYLSVLVIALALYAWAGQWGLSWYRRTANESAALAYEETVRSVQTLASVLDTGPYATDAEMCDRICCEAYACAAAAESAMSTLPFSTWELEQLSAWLNTVADYAHALCGQGEPFSASQRRELEQLSAQADDFSGTLLSLRQQLQDRELRMDSREKRLRNVGSESAEPLSGKLGAYEAGFSLTPLRYDGQYSAAAAKKSGGLLTEEEMLRAAAEFLGEEESALTPLPEQAGPDGRRCYRAGDRLLIVGRAGVESLSCGRLVFEEKLDMPQAREAAERFLERRGYGELELLSARQEACLALFTFARIQDGALCPDCVLRLTISLEDGALLSFDASDYSPEPLPVSWSLDEDAARAALPAGLEGGEAARRILRSPGGKAVPCYVFSSRDGRGRSVEIAVRADTGKQYRITVK